MLSMKLSSKNQVVIPKQVREQLKIRPGSRLFISITSNNEFKISTETLESTSQIPDHPSDNATDVGS